MPNRFRGFRLLLASLVLLTAFAVLPVHPASAIAQVFSSDVPMFRGNPARTGEMPGPAPVGTPSEIWTFGIGGVLGSSPAIVEGVAYIGGGFDGNLYAVDAASGQERWRFITGDYYGVGYFSSPAVVDGVVFVGSPDGMYALDAASGQQQWRFTAGDYYGVGFYSSPAVSDGVVFIGSGDGFLYAVDTVSGLEQWRFETADEFTSSPTVAEGVVFVSIGSYMYAVDAATGQEQWRFLTDGVAMEAAPAVADGIIFVGNIHGVLLAIDVVSGQELWRFATSTRTDYQLPFMSSPAVVGSDVFVGSYDGNLYAVDSASGSERWKFTTGVAYLAAPAVADGVVFVGSRDGFVYALGEPDPVLRAEQNATSLALRQASDFAAAFVDATIDSTDLPKGITTPLPADDSFTPPPSTIPPDTLASEVVRFSLDANANATTWLAYSVYGSSEEAHLAFEAAPQVLARAGWQVREPTGIEHISTCLTLQTAVKSEAICYVSRNDVIITSYSMLPLDAIDAVYLNANDLARFGSDIYDQVNG